jgi:hypothetical protein
MLDEFITEDELAVTLRRGKRTLRIWRQKREGPPFTTIGREVMYRKQAVTDWLRSREVSPVREQRKAGR